MRTVPTIACLLATCALAACGTEAPDSSTATGGGDAAADASFVLASLPGDVGEAGHVRDAKASAAEGERVVLRGIIGGRADAMSESTASFTMVDERLNNPCLADDDHCSKPWDYCCSPREELMANTASVQVVGEDGSVRRLDLRSVGVDLLDTVVVIGTVAARPSNEVLMIKAESIHVVDG